MSLKNLSFIAVLLLSVIASAQSPGGWQNLFNGKDLTGWKPMGGKAEFSVENGVIVGRTVVGSRNSFLVTEKEYGDFILEADVFVEDEEGNSGIQTRSHFNPAAFNGEGRVYGRQCEVDPTFRRWTGGIYDEGRREWLYPMQLNAQAQNVYKKGEFNHFRVECIGNEMRTWVNDVATAYVVDTLDPKGFIGLQVHAINSPDHAGKKVLFKNIRIKTTDLQPLPFPPNIYVSNFVVNSLTDYEKTDGWRLLFDGKTSNGWRSAKDDKFPSKGWNINNGVISVASSEGREAANGGDIITNGQFAAFDLSFEFKLTPGANSGIKYFVTLDEATKGSAIGLEYQVLDDSLHPDAKMGRDGNRTLASLYDMIKAEKQKRFLRPIGQWNFGRIIVYPNDKVEHYLNGVKVLEYIRGSKEYRDLVAISKYVVWKNFGEAPRGHILIQDHGNEVSYRSIKIKDLKPAQRPAARAPVPTVLPGRGLAQHDFLYSGQWDTRKDSQTILLVRGGKIAWKYSIPNNNHNGVLSEFSDMHMLPNGNILYAMKTGAQEITPAKKIVWSYECPAGTECHSAQPIGNDKVFLCQNGTPAKVMLINKRTNKIEMEHEVATAKPDDPKSVHGQFRNVRMTDAGTYLLAHLNMGKVVEYDKNWNPIWSVDAPSAWAATRLKNGNTLISGNQHGYVREVNAKGDIVWEVNKDDLPGFPLYTVHQVSRLANGNTVISNWGGFLRKEDWDKVVQVIEVTPSKKVVWALHQWKNPDLGPSSCIQILKP